jgi:PAS domain S-box-containing protein
MTSDEQYRRTSPDDGLDAPVMSGRERRLLDAVAAPCVVTDLRGRYVHGNPGFHRLVGQDAAAMAGRTLSDCLSADVAEALRLVDRESLAGNTSQSCDGSVVTASGATKSVRCDRTLLRDDNGAPSAMMTTLVDLSDLQAAQTAQAAAELQREAINQGFPGILGYFDRNLQAVWVNDGIRRFCADPLGRSCREIFCRRRTSCDHACAIWRAMQSGKIEKRVKCVELSNEEGEEQVYDVTGVPVVLASGAIDGVVMMARDVSERHRLEKQLRHTQKMEAIGTLAGGIAHDFNNVLTPIMGYSEIVRLKMRRDGYPDQTVSDYIDEILKAARRAKSLVEQILTFSRSHEKKEILQHIHPIVKEVMKLMRVTLPATIQIKEEIDEHCGLVSVDPVQIHQVLINLCTNSAHAMAGRRGTMTVRLAKAGRDEDGMEWVELSVADTGCGIEAEMLDRIFEPYFTTKEKSRGTGMGLAMVHGIITRQGGRITVESQIGVGTVFRVLLPISREPTQLEQIISMTEIMQGEGRILLVDDEEQVVDVTGQMLRSLGYEVVGMTSATEALSLFSKGEREFDLLITDLTMPDLTGIELTARFRSLRPDLPVVLFTGYSEQFSRQLADQAGILDYCTKPLTLRQLASVVHRVLRRADVAGRG